jgi:hypothetical protein
MYDETFDCSSVSPFEIANKLFTSDPLPKNSNELRIPDADSNVMTYLFEILANILLEGLDIKFGGLNNVALSDDDYKQINLLNPWFNSIGYNVNCEKIDRTSPTLDNTHYCRVMIKTPLYEHIFHFRNIQKNYHFMLNGPSLHDNNLKTKLSDLYMIYNPSDNYSWKISFAFYHSTILTDK